MTTYWISILQLGCAAALAVTASLCTRTPRSQRWILGIAAIVMLGATAVNLPSARHGHGEARQQRIDLVQTRLDTLRQQLDGLQSLGGKLTEVDKDRLAKIASELAAVKDDLARLRK